MGKRELIKGLSGIRLIRLIRGLFKVSAGTAGNLTHYYFDRPRQSPIGKGRNAKQALEMITRPDHF